MSISQTLNRWGIRWHHLLCFGIWLAFLPAGGFSFDMKDRPEWMAYMLEHGLGKAYDSGANYLPFGLMILYAIALFQGSKEVILSNFMCVKGFFLFFDFAVVWLVLYFFRKKGYVFSSFWAYLFFLNYAFLYNSYVWGQQDSFHTFWVVLSLILALQKQPVWAIFFLVLAINAKLQSIIFLPIIGLILLPYIKLKEALKAILVLICTQFVLFLPFILAGSFKQALGVIGGSVGFFTNLSPSAYNIWHFLTSKDPAHILDTEYFFIKSYKAWGIVLFFSISALALLPLISKGFNVWKFKQKLDKPYVELVFLTAGMIGLIFFFVNTQMHERYIHPCLILFGAYGILTKRFALYILCSLAYLWNMDDYMNHITWWQSTFLVQPRFVASLYLIVFTMGFYQLYRFYFTKPYFLGHVAT